MEKVILNNNNLQIIKLVDADNNIKYDVRAFGKSSAGETSWKNFIGISEYEYSILIKKVLGKKVSFVWNKKSYALELMDLIEEPKIEGSLFISSNKTLITSAAKYELGDLLIDNDVIGNIFELDMFEEQDKVTALLKSGEKALKVNK